MNGGEAIERFLDRSWMSERLSIRIIAAHRVALVLSNAWMGEQRHTSLLNATTLDLRALLMSSEWQAISANCEGLPAVLSRFYRSLCDCGFREDDPIASLIGRHLSPTMSQRFVPKAAPRLKRRREPAFRN